MSLECGRAFQERAAQQVTHGHRMLNSSGAHTKNGMSILNFIQLTSNAKEGRQQTLEPPYQNW